MLDGASTPPTIRITRPYTTEDEYLDQELGTITRTSITLVGAQPRPEGAMLRFELVLPSGVVLVRGEGRVVGYKQEAHHGVGGVTLRFTRLDARSKTLIDKAAGLREKRRSSSPPGAALQPPPLPVPVPAAPAVSQPVSPPAAAPTGEREDLLDRLRARAKVLDPDAVRRILERRRQA